MECFDNAESEEDYLCSDTKEAFARYLGYLS